MVTPTSNILTVVINKPVEYRLKWGHLGPDWRCSSREEADGRTVRARLGEKAYFPGTFQRDWPQR